MSTISSNPSAPLDIAPLRAADEKEPRYYGLSAAAWVKILIVAGLLVALFRFNLARLWNKTNPIDGDPNWGHTPIIPIIGLYYLFLNRDSLLAATVKPILFERLTRVRLIVSAAAILGGGLFYFAGAAIVGALIRQSDQLAAFAPVLGMALAGWGVLMLVLGWGLGNLLFGIAVFVAGIYPARNDWLSDYGMVHTIFGTVLTLCGWQVMRFAWFPIAFLVCGLPWPGLVYSLLASPLQHLAAAVAVKTLNLTGIDSVRSGTKMFITTANGTLRPLNVAEACAGLRSLMTFISVAAAVAFLSNRMLWQKVLITFSAIPIAIFCNVMRVTGQAYLDRLAGPQWSENFAHQFVGLVMLIPAFFLILLFAWLVDQIFVEEVDEKSKLRAAMAAKRAGAVPASTAEKKIIVIPQSAKVQAAAASAGAPAKPQAAGAPVRLPPRTNLTGKNPPANERPVEGT